MKLKLILALVAATAVTTGLARATDVGTGKKLYVDNCQKCYGAKGKAALA